MSENMRITGKGIAAVHMMPHARPADDPWNSVCEAIGRDIDALRDQRDALSAALSDCEAALREIVCGKVQSDNEHPLGEAWSMSGRFIEIARSALIRAEKTRGGTL